MTFVLGAKSLAELIDGIDTAIRDGVSVQRQILTELVRGGK